MAEMADGDDDDDDDCSDLTIRQDGMMMVMMDDVAGET